jgi:Ca2+-binding RTX toxin-like protein
MSSVPAQAAIFTVTDTQDLPDALRGDGLCRSSAGTCTLRAAVEESNALRGRDTINVNAGTYVVNRTPAPAFEYIMELPFREAASFTGAGRDQTIIDGGDTAALFRVATDEVMVIDSTADRVVSLRHNGSVAETFVASGAGGLDLPVRIRRGPPTMASDVLVTTGNGVYRYSVSTGAFVSQIIPGTVAGNVWLPTDITQGPSEVGSDLFAPSFLPSGAIHRFDETTGAYVGQFAPGRPGAQPTALRWHYFPNGVGPQLLVAVTNENRILRYSANGTLLGNFAVGVPTPRDMVIRDGILYVAAEGANSIMRFNLATGAQMAAFVAPGVGGLSQPRDLGFDADGDLLVTSFGNQRILRYDGDTGRYMGIFAQPSAGMTSVGSFLLIQSRDNGPTVNFNDFSIQNAVAQDLYQGSAFHVQTGAGATLFDSDLRNNASRGWGGAVRNEGYLDLRDVSVTGNETPVGGGGVTSAGGGIHSSGSLYVSDSLIADNFASKGGGVSIVAGSAQLTNTTISGNESQGQGGGLRVEAGNAAISFMTITENKTFVAGGENYPFGGGVWVGANGGLQMANSIVANNSDNRQRFDADYSPDCYSATLYNFVSTRDNLVGILSDNCLFTDQFWGDTSFMFFGTEDAPLDAGLLPLADNGGPTLTHALESSSLALDADNGDQAGSFFECADHDQRGFDRPIDADFDGSADCDLGAFEAPVPLVVNAGPNLVLECSASGRATGTLSGSVQSAGTPSYSWTAPGAQLQTPTQASTSGSFPLGNTTATLTVTLGGATASDSALVSVLDTRDPVITPPADVYPATCGAANIGQATATDACGSNVTIVNDAPATYRAGVTVVTWRAIDSLGNESQATQRVIVALGDNSNCCPVGANIITGSANNDNLTGTAGVDCILGLGGQDVINGAGGNDVISGGEGNDTIDGGAGNDAIQGGGGQDQLRGGENDDALMCNDGDDSAWGGNGNDLLFGGLGQDKLYGEAGNDQLSGHDGTDRLEGGAGNDTLNGGPASDTCLGGAGSNTLIACEL